MKAKGKRLQGKSCPRWGALMEEVRPFSMERVFFSNYPFWVCSKYGEVLTPPETNRVLEKVARAKELFGHGPTVSKGPTRDSRKGSEGPGVDLGVAPVATSAACSSRSVLDRAGRR